MSEISIAFGPDRHLIGTLSLPEGGARQGCAVLLLNAGVIHRIGPHRFNVKLARELARRGVPSLRFDISGQGDSRVPANALPFERQAVADLRAAMDHMQRLCSVDQFVVAGICSGAQNGLAVADEDPRVAGLWMLDPYIYPTRKTQWVRYHMQLKAGWWRTIRSWVFSLSQHVMERLRQYLRPRTDEPTVVDYGHRIPGRAAFAALLNRLSERGTRICLIYTGSMLWNYNYPEQLRDAFAGEPFLEAVRCEFMPDVDHTATLLKSQQKLIEQMCKWLDESM